MDKILLNSAKLVRGGSNRLTRNYHELLLQLHSPTSTSNPLTRTTNTDCIYNAELNFLYNFSIVVGSWSAVGFTYYGYTEDVAGSLIVNNTKYSDIDLFSTDNVRWEYYGFRFGYKISKTSLGYYYGSKITLPTGEVINYNTGDPKKNSSLYTIMDYLQSNNGKQIYLRVD